MKKKDSYDITHKVMRVQVGDYTFLAELSRKTDTPMAETLHLVLTGQAKRQTVVAPGSQISMGMPVPVIAVNGTKAPAEAQYSEWKPAIGVNSTTSSAVNGSKVAAFMSKIKGVSYG